MMHTFGTDINGGLVFERPTTADGTHDTSAPARPPAGTVILARNASDGSALSPSSFTTLAGGRWTYSVDSDTSTLQIQVSEDNGVTWSGALSSAESIALALTSGDNAASAVSIATAAQLTANDALSLSQSTGARSVNGKTPDANGAVTLVPSDLGALPVNGPLAAANVTGLAAVATSGNFTDLSNRPPVAIPLDQKGVANGVAALNPAGQVLDGSGNVVSGGSTTQVAADAVAPLVSKLDQRQPSAVAVVLGDSTGVPPTTGTWVLDAAGLIGAKWKACKVTTRLWSGSSYPAPTTVAAGALSRTVASDTFTRTAADLIGSTPDVGGVWQSTSTGKYTVDGSKAAFVNGATGVTAQRLPAVTAGRMKSQATLTFIYDGGAHIGQYQFLSSYVDASNFLWVEMNMGSNQVIFKKSTTAGGTVVLGTFTRTDIGVVANVSPQSITFIIDHSGDNVTFTVGPKVATYALSSADSTLFAGGSQMGFWAQVNDHSWDNVSVVGAADPATTLDIYNGSVSSTKADYPLTRISAMIPVAPDVVFISYGHNYLADTPATFQAALDTLASAILAQWPGTPIVIVSQNPEKAPAANVAAHALREQSKRAYAIAHGYGYLPAYEAFQGKDYPGDYIQSDGVHPTTSGTTDGGALWAAAAQAYLNASSHTISA